jgi:hypothetical protein
MGDKFFPRSIKPLTSKTYSMSRGSNVFQTPTQGGIARQALKFTLEPVPFSLNFILSDNAYAALLNFYDVAINHGANSFKMNLDSGTGILEHQCFIKPGTFKANRPSHNNWFVNFTATAEVTPSQNEVCDNLYQLFDCYGDQSNDVLNAFEDFVTGSYFA